MVREPLRPHRILPPTESGAANLFMGDPANLSLGEMKLALQRWRTPQAEVDACLEKDDLIALYKRQRELSEARCVSLLWLLSPDGQVRLDGSIFFLSVASAVLFVFSLSIYTSLSLPVSLPPSLHLYILPLR